MFMDFASCPFVFVEGECIGQNADGTFNP
jgi:hypothetical protein